MASQNDLLPHRGFTSHEWLPWFNLYNMNGRLYDPVVGRFLSPDNYVQAPDFSQSFNRYSYVWNNPLRYTDPDGEWMHLVVGGIIGGIQGYMIGKSVGLSGGNLFLSTLAGAGVGALSGGVASSLASSGGTMANTLAIAGASHVNSVGMGLIGGFSGVEVPYSLSFGAASVTMSSKGFDFGYLGKPGNSKMQNIGYGFGAMANLQDIFTWNNGTTVDVHAKLEATGHSTVSVPDGSISISVGPAGGIPVNPGSNFEMELEWLWKAATKKWNGRQFGQHATYPGGWHFELKNVNKGLLESMTNNITEGVGLLGFGKLRYGLGFGCVQHTSRALLRVGVPTLPVNFHPLMLNTQLFVRQMGIFASPYIINF